MRGHAIAGRDSIECMVVKADAETAREEEIEENLFRNELSALEKIDAVAEYRRLFEIRFGEIQAGNPEFSNCANLAQLEDLSLLGIAEDSEQGGFFGRVTDRLGLSRRQAQRFSTIARTLQPRLKTALQQSAAEDHLSLIERFSRYTPEDQARLALAMETETDFDAVAAEALVFARPQLSMAAKRMATVTSNFSALGKRERRRLLREMVLRWRDDFEWALNAADDAEEDAE
jgi:ParB family chromosome partitioning protein